MKRITLLTLLFLTSLSAQAYTFTANANVQVTPLIGTVQVFNHLNRPIICSGRADGITIRGNVVNVYMNNLIIHPRQFSSMYVRTTPYDVFRFVRPFINCRTL